MKKIIIILYFGNLPNYFNLYLKSCSLNHDFDFLLITDQSVDVEEYLNITAHSMSFESLNKLVKLKLGSDFRVFSPYKLCDYRPAYGKIFEDYIVGYDIWGYCDQDMIFGQISSFISDKDFAQYDRLLVNGHLAFYRNHEDVNHYYAINNLRKMSFEKASRIKAPCFYDEIFSVVSLRVQGVEIYENFKFLDVLPQYRAMVLAEQPGVINRKGQVFYYENGRVFCQYLESGKTIIDEFMYIHLQKRKMNYGHDVLKSTKRIYIHQESFSDNLVDSNATGNGLIYFASYKLKQLKALSVDKVKIKLLILRLKITGKV